MKAGWQTNTLGDVLAVIRNGVNCKQDKSGNGDRISRIESISDATFDLEKVGYAELSEREKEKNRLEQGDILFSHINSAIHVGKTAVFDCEEPVYHGVNLLLMRPKEVVTSAYLDHALKYLFQRGYWRGVCKQSVNQASVNQQDISRVEIRYPQSLVEQQRIVGLLDEAFEGLATAKANAKENLQNARALFESHLQSIFTQRGQGWVEKRLDALAKFSQGIQIGFSDQSNAPAKGWVRFIRIIDYTQGTDDIRYVQDPGCRYWVDKSDIVMVRYGTPGLVGRGIEGVIANNLFKISILDGSLTNDFLAYFLGQQTVQNYLSSQGSSTMPALTFTQLGAVMVSFPHEMEEQRGIATKLDSLREETQRLARLYERKLAALEALKKSLLHQAFSGEL